MLESLVNNVSRPAISFKQTTTQVLSCEYCGIFENIYFGEHLRTAACAGKIHYVKINFLILKVNLMNALFRKMEIFFFLNLDLSLIDSANNQIDQSEEKFGYVKKHIKLEANSFYL